jgi:hypothetical protein
MDQVLRTPKSREDVLLWTARALFVGLLVLSIVPPFVPIFGPLSLDDLFPLVAVVIGLLFVPFGKRDVFDPAMIGLALLGVAGIVSSATNATSGGDLLRLLSRSAGRVAFYVSLVAAIRVLLDDDRWVRRTLFAFVAAATAESLFGLFAFATRYKGPWGIGVAEIPRWSVLYGHTRVHGTFSGQLLAYENVNASSNFLAAYLLMSIVVTAGLAIAERGRLVRSLLVGSALLQLVTLYVTYTRAALLALAIAVLAAGWLLGRKKAAVAAVIIFIVVGLSIPTLRAKFLQEGHDRYALWWSGIVMTLDHAFSGVGDGNYMSELARQPRYSHSPFGVSTSIVHNSMLLSAASHGLFGLIAHGLLYVLMLGVALKMTHRASGPARVVQVAVASAIIGYVVQDQFNSLAYVSKVATQLWFLYGLIPLVARRYSPQVE